MELSVNKDPRIYVGYPFKPDDMPFDNKSYIETDLLNGDGAKYGVAFIFFPLTEGYPLGDPNEFRAFVTDDIWRQIHVKECASLEAAIAYRETFQSALTC